MNPAVELRLLLRCEEGQQPVLPRHADCSASSRLPAELQMLLVLLTEHAEERLRIQEVRRLLHRPDERRLFRLPACLETQVAERCGRFAK